MASSQKPLHIRNIFISEVSGMIFDLLTPIKILEHSDDNFSFFQEAVNVSAFCSDKIFYVIMCWWLPTPRTPNDNYHNTI